MSSKINVLEIISKHKSTIQNSDGKVINADKRHFVVYPILIGLLVTIIVSIPSEGLVNLFAVCLSIFIGLFLNLLVLIISFAENNQKVQDQKNRAKLIEETFYNITYTIIASLMGLGLLFLANAEIFPESWTIVVAHTGKCIWFEAGMITINKIITLLLYFMFYSMFAHIIMTLLMIVKRVFKLFKIQIEELSKME